MKIDKHNDHDVRIDALTVKEVIDWLGDKYNKKNYYHSVARSQRTLIIQMCDMYLESKRRLK